MNENTTLLILKDIYKEISLVEKLDLQTALKDSIQVQNEYDQLKRGSKILPKVTFSPKPNLIQTLLDYSSENSLEPQC